jgi:D-alanine-D-alanine ligase
MPERSIVMKIPFVVHKLLQKPAIKKADIYIEIVGSSNPRLNSMTGSTRLAIKELLSRQYAKVGITLVDDFTSLERLAAKKPDLVVLGMKLILLDQSKGYNDSPKMWLADYLHAQGINFTGSASNSLALEIDKQEAKQKVLDANLQSSKYLISTITDPTTTHMLAYPLFVKPTNRGGSKGVDNRSVVYSAAELHAKVASIHLDCKSDALIEEYLPGREFSVAVVRRPNSDELVAMPIEIIAPANMQGNSFLSGSVKEADSEQVVAVNDTALETKLNALAIGAFEALGSRDFGRIDMRLDAHGLPSFIEANLMPGLSNHGYLSRCFALNGHHTYQDMILAIVMLSLERTTTSLANTLDSSSFDDISADNAIVQGV